MREAGEAMNREVLVVHLNDGGDLLCNFFENYGDAEDFVEKNENKAVIVGAFNGGSLVVRDRS